MTREDVKEDDDDDVGRNAEDKECSKWVEGGVGSAANRLQEGKEEDMRIAKTMRPNPAAVSPSLYSAKILL